MRYVICVVILAVVASHVIKRESDEIARAMRERDAAYQLQLENAEAI